MRRVAAYLLLTYALSSIFYVRIAATGKMSTLAVLGLMWCPGIAALLIRVFTQHDLRDEGWQLGPERWLFWSYVLPPILAGAVYGLVWITGIGGLSAEAHRPLIPFLLIHATVGFLFGVVFALGEEIGWRGFLVPELARTHSFTRTSLISGVAWSLYHYPLILFADYHSAAPKWFALGAFTWMVMAMAFVYAWFRLRSGNVWTAVFLHASHNLFVQQIFDPLTQDRAHTPYVTTEFGAGLAIVYTIVAIYCYTRPSTPRLRQSSPPASTSVPLAKTQNSPSPSLE